MDLLPLALIQSVDAARTNATSALPNAPVVAERPPRLAAPRRATAALLARAAAALEPKTAPECRPAL